MSNILIPRIFSELSARKGARIFNRPDALRSHNEKLTIAQFPEFMVPTLVTADQEQLRSFHAEYRDIILKPLNAMGGDGVFRIGEDGLNLGAAIEILTASGRKAVMAQRYIPDIVEGDKRVLLINGQGCAICFGPYSPKGGSQGKSRGWRYGQGTTFVGERQANCRDFSAGTCRQRTFPCWTGYYRQLVDGSECDQSDLFS